MDTQTLPLPLLSTQRLIRLAPWLLLLGGILLSLLAGNLARQQEDERRQAAFALTLEKLANGIDARMTGHEFVLRGVAGLFSASQRVDRAEFRRYVQNLHLETGYPGIQGIGFSEWIPPGQLEGHERRIRQEGFPDYRVRPPEPRDSHSSIIYLEPFNWRNQRAFGYDMYSEPVRRAAMQRAMNTGLASLSGRVTLVQETEKDIQAGTLLYVPIYAEGKEPAEGEARNKHLLGWAYSPLRMRDMMEGVLDNEFPELAGTMSLALYDGDSLDEAHLLFHSQVTDSLEGGLHGTQQLDIQGRRWTLVARTTAGFSHGGESGRSTTLLFGGLLVTALLALSGFGYQRAHRRISHALSEVSLAHQSLRKSQSELQAIYAASDAAMFIIDGEGRILQANPRMAEMFGCEMSALIGSAYFDYLPPTEQAENRAHLARLGSAAVPNLGEEQRFQRCDGRLFHGYLSARSLGGEHPAQRQIVGVIIDTSELHDAQIRLQQSEQRYRTLTETMLDVVWTVDVETQRFTYCSPAITAMRGYAVDEVLGQPLTLGMPEARAGEVLRALAERARRFQADEFGPEEFFVDDLLQTRKDGSTVWTEVISNFYRDAESGRLSMRGVTRDIDERKRAEEERRIAAVAFESHESIIVTDASGTVVRVNHAFEELNGYTAAEIIGKSTRLLHSGRHNEEFYGQMWQTIVRDGFWRGEIWNRRKDGELSPQWLTITAVRNESGQTTHYVGTAFDISQRLARENEIRNLAFYDPLTGLANRRLLLDRLSHAFAKSSRSGQLGALIYLDLDHFKELNDRLGHGEGDRLLTIVADRLNLSVREGDTVARLGGDEFVVLLEDLHPTPAAAGQQALVVAEKLHAALNTPYMLQGRMPDDWKCTPSIGVALFADHRESSEALLERADRALYAAKKAGRNTIRFAVDEVVVEPAGGEPPPEPPPAA